MWHGQGAILCYPHHHWGHAFRGKKWWMYHYKCEILLPSFQEVVGISPADTILCHCHCLYPSHSSKIQLQGVVLKSGSGVGSIHGRQSNRGEPDPSPAERRHTEPGGVGQSSAKQWHYVGLNQGSRAVLKTTGDTAQRVQILGVCQLLFSIALGSGIGILMVGIIHHLVFVWETMWCCVGMAAILSLSWGPCGFNLQGASSILPCPGSHTELRWWAAFVCRASSLFVYFYYLYCCRYCVFLIPRLFDFSKLLPRPRVCFCHVLSEGAEGSAMAYLESNFQVVLDHHTISSWFSYLS